VGRWSVVISRPFAGEGANNPAWGPGKSTQVTFAVWDGGHEERGARKSVRMGWVLLAIQ